MTNVDKIEKLLEELAQEVKNADGAIMAIAIVPCSENESTVIGRSIGNTARIAVAIFEAEKENEYLQKVRDYYKLIETKFQQPI